MTNTLAYYIINFDLKKLNDTGLCGLYIKTFYNRNNYFSIFSHYYQFLIFQANVRSLPLEWLQFASQVFCKISLKTGRVLFLK
jgi:hypothetical protein